jgi:anti-sigma B factor antagonist
MIRAEENTIVSWAADDTAPRGLGHASSLQMRCAGLHKQNDGAFKVLRVAGSVDSGTSEELFAKIGLLLRSDRLSSLIVDLEGVSRMDSSGVGVLLTALRDSQKRGVRFTLCSLPRPLHTMLERMRLASMFEIRATLEEAFNL